MTKWCDRCKNESATTMRGWVSIEGNTNNCSASVFQLWSHEDNQAFSFIYRVDWRGCEWSSSIAFSSLILTIIRIASGRKKKDHRAHEHRVWSSCYNLKYHGLEDKLMLFFATVWLRFLFFHPAVWKRTFFCEKDVLICAFAVINIHLKEIGHTRT